MSTLKTFDDYTHLDYAKIAEDIVSLSQKNEQELYTVLGHTLNDLGIKSSNKPDVLFERADKETNAISALKGFNFVSNTEVLDLAKAKQRGKEFFQKFGKKVQKAICEDSHIVDLIQGETGDLATKLKQAIPEILGLIGVGVVIAPIYITLIAIAVALIIKVGLDLYCSTEDLATLPS